jgi:hypothetical protein
MTVLLSYFQKRPITNELRLSSLWATLKYFLLLTINLKRDPAASAWPARLAVAVVEGRAARRDATAVPSYGWGLSGGGSGHHRR